MDLSMTSAATALPMQKKKKRAWFRRPNYVIFATDSAAILLTALLSLLLMHPNAGPNWPWMHYSGAILLAWLTFTTYGFTNHFYDWRHFSEQIARTSKAFGAVIAAFGALLLTGFMFKWTDNFSRLWIGSWFMLLTFYILVSRVAITWYLDKLPDGLVHHRHAIILGADENGQNILKHLCRFKGHGVKVVGFVDDRCSRLPPTRQTSRCSAAPMNSSAWCAKKALIW